MLVWVHKKNHIFIYSKQTLSYFSVGFWAMSLTGYYVVGILSLLLVPSFVFVDCCRMFKIKFRIFI